MKKTIFISKEKVFAGNLILVNRDYGYHKQLTDLSMLRSDGGTEIPLESTATLMLNRLMAEIGGWEHIVPVSGWRSLEEQQKIWDDSLAENGREFTEKYVAVPGHSEHQTGLAIDLGFKQPEIDFIRPDFPYEGICQTFRERAAEYGFVERYPADKRHITGIGHEPWHFRYVGTPHAAVMAGSGMVLEEYVEFLHGYCHRKNPYTVQTDQGEIWISYVKAEDEITEVKIEDTYPCSVSGNNADGFIITEYRV